MPLYTFKLSDGSCEIEDETGVVLPDREHARHYACDVVRELMNCREQQTRTWLLGVYEDNRERVFEIPFVSIDWSLDYLRPELRSTIEDLCGRARRLTEAITAAGATLRESRALVARSRGKPYLAAERGRKTIRGS
jgi:hypothetical protein